MESGKNQSGKIIIEIFFIFLYNKVVIKNYNLIFFGEIYENNWRSKRRNM